MAGGNSPDDYVRYGVRDAGDYFYWPRNKDEENENDALLKVRLDEVRRQNGLSPDRPYHFGEIPLVENIPPLPPDDD